MRGLYRKVRIDIAEEERRKIVEKNEKVILRQTGEWKNFNNRQEEIKEEKLHSRKNTDTVQYVLLKIT